MLKTSSLPDTITEVEYEQTLLVSGNTGVLTWFIDSGDLPEGITLDNGVLSGVPTTEGTYEFIVKVTDDTDTDLREYSLTVTKSNGDDDAGEGRTVNPSASPPASNTENDDRGLCFINNMLLSPFF